MTCYVKRQQKNNVELTGHRKTAFPDVRCGHRWGDLVHKHHKVEDDRRRNDKPCSGKQCGRF